MTDADRKFLAALLLFVLWAALVMLGMTPVDPLIQTVREVLIALGVYHSTLINPKG